MPDLVSATKHDDVLVVTINNPPVNALSPGVPEGIAIAAENAASDDSVKAVVLIGGGRTFIAGADIKEFGKITSGQKRGIRLNEVLERVENCSKPFIAAIHGTAFGGGLETAMACHYRVAVPSAQLGQPEVKLGIIPGAGGTQRLPRLIGVAKAAELCAIGDPISAAQAHHLGLVDRIIEGDLQEGALAFARELVAAGTPPRRTCDIDDRFGDAAERDAAITALKQTLAKRARGRQAPLNAIAAVEAAATLPFDEGLNKEAELFNECLFADESKAMIHVFFGEREVRKIPGLAKDTPSLPIKSAAVVGAGTMGGGIAMVYANAGISVLLKETEQELLDRGWSRIKSNYDRSVKRGSLTGAQVEERMALIRPTLTYDEFAEADIIVEAVFEEMALKKQVFAELDSVAKKGAVLASNTSTLDVDEIASATSRPQMVIGHHYFAPPNVMRLLEIVRGAKSSDQVIATSMDLARRLGKVGVLVGNCRGFVGNRMYGPYQREAQFLLEEGGKVEEVDRALYDFGMAMGPLATGDLSGLDVGWRIRKESGHLVPEGMRQPLVADKLCEMGRYGQKTQAGWYRYEEGSRTPTPDPEVEKLIESTASEVGIARRTITPEECVERTIYALVNEGAKILEEGFALRSVDIDTIYINGYGFPAHRGGPMFYADLVGLKNVYERICQFEQEHGFWWKPPELLKELAQGGRSFAEFDKQKAGK